MICRNKAQVKETDIEVFSFVKRSLKGNKQIIVISQLLYIKCDSYQLNIVNLYHVITYYYFLTLPLRIYCRQSFRSRHYIS